MSHQKEKSHYHLRVEELQSGGVDISKLQSQSSSWAGKSIRHHNKAIIPFAEKNLISELKEVDAELNRHGFPNYDAKAVKTEALDVGSVILSFANANGIALKGANILPGVNGYGNKSNITEKLSEIGSNIELKSVERDLERLLQYWVAFIAGLPETFNVDLQDVAKKNGKNYPKHFFNGQHPLLHRPLNEDELIQQYEHARLCMKMIRHVHREILNEREKDYGVDTIDWKPYQLLILDFEHSDLNVMSLAMQICEHQRLTLDQTEEVFSKFITNATVLNENRKAA